MTSIIKLTVDEKEIQVEEGGNLLRTCLDNGIYIPNLCFLETMQDPPASCRLCFVEVDGKRDPVASCKVKAVEGMVVRTNTEPVRRLQRTALRLLLSVHEAQCKNCPSNRRCDLQSIARLLGVRLRPRRLDHIDRHIDPRWDDPFLEFVPSRCILCGKCIEVCRAQNGQSFLTFAKRGFDSVLTSFGEDVERRGKCGKCRACVEICPVSAIILKDIQGDASVSAGLE